MATDPHEKIKTLSLGPLRSPLKVEISYVVSSITSKKLNFLKQLVNVVFGKCYSTSRKLSISWGLLSSVDEYTFNEGFRQRDTGSWNWVQLKELRLSATISWQRGEGRGILVKVPKQLTNIKIKLQLLWLISPMNLCMPFVQLRFLLKRCWKAIKNQFTWTKKMCLI